MITLEHIKDYIIDKVLILPECNNLGLVYFKEGQYLSFIDDIKYYEQAKANPSIKALLWDSKIELPDVDLPIKIIKT